MNRKFKNEILIEGYYVDKDIINKNFKIRNGNDVIEFRYYDDKLDEIIDNLDENMIVKVKGSFDKDDKELFLLANDILILKEDKRGEV